MPRSNLCKQNMTVADFLRGKMSHRTQTEIAQSIGISQQMLSKKLCTNRFTSDELKRLIKVLELTDTEIVYAMRECR